MPSSAEAKASLAKPAAADAGADSGMLGRLSELAWQALPAIGSAIGFAGFVAVIGAAIEWIRFSAAHLPATQAVLAVPHQELVIVGALALAAFVAGGVLAVVLVYLIDNNGNATLATVRAIVAVGVIEMLVTLFYIDAEPWWTYVILVGWLMIVGLVAGDIAGEAMRDFRSRTKLKRAAAVVVAARDGLLAARLAREAANEIDEKFPTAQTVEAREKADLAFATAERDWESSVRDWEAEVKEILIGLPKGKGKQVEKVRDKLDGYGKTPPDGDELAKELAEAETKTGHVFLAIWARLGTQASDLAGWIRRRIDNLVTVLVWVRGVLGKALRAIKVLWATARRKTPSDPATSATPTSSDAGPAAQTVAPGKETAEQTPSMALVVVAWIIGVLLLAAIVVGTIFVIDRDLFSWLAIVLGVVTVLTTMNVFVARATEKFAWYGISVFFSVLMFGATLTIAKTLDKPSAQPIALVRKSDDVGICGVFITQTSSRIYVGRLALEEPENPSLRRPGLIFWVPTSDVALVDVGNLEIIGRNFPKLASRMLAQLYKDRAEEGPTGPGVKNETITEVTGSEVIQGSTKGKQTTTVHEVAPKASYSETSPHPSPPDSLTRTSCTASRPTVVPTPSGKHNGHKPPRMVGHH